MYLFFMKIRHVNKPLLCTKSCPTALQAAQERWALPVLPRDKLADIGRMNAGAQDESGDYSSCLCPSSRQPIVNPVEVEVY